MQTLRREMIRLLSDGERSTKELSQILKIREKEIYEHLFHIKRSLESQKRKLIITPARCLQCGYTFESRNRFTSPGKCPKCRNEHIEDPKYRTEEPRDDQKR